MGIVDEKGEVRGNVVGFSVRILQTAFCPTHLFMFLSKNGEKTKERERERNICLTQRLTA